jgi:hypothetical protein
VYISFLVHKTNSSKRTDRTKNRINHDAMRSLLFPRRFRIIEVDKSRYYFAYDIYIYIYVMWSMTQHQHRVPSPTHKRACSSALIRSKPQPRHTSTRKSDRTSTHRQAATCTDRLTRRSHRPLNPVIVYMNKLRTAISPFLPPPFLLPRAHPFSLHQQLQPSSRRPFLVPQKRAGEQPYQPPKCDETHDPP